MPEEISAKVWRAFIDTLNDPETRAELGRVAVDSAVVPLERREFEQFLAAETAGLRELGKRVGLSID